MELWSLQHAWNFGLGNMLGTLIFATGRFQRTLDWRTQKNNNNFVVPFLQHDCNMLEVGATLCMSEF